MFIAFLIVSTASQRHVRRYAEHPRLLAAAKTWMAGTSPAMTDEMSC
jgi:hypothetical protein